MFGTEQRQVLNSCTGSSEALWELASRRHELNPTQKRCNYCPLPTNSMIAYLVVASIDGQKITGLLHGLWENGEMRLYPIDSKYNLVIPRLTPISWAEHGPQLYLPGFSPDFLKQ